MAEVIGRQRVVDGGIAWSGRLTEEQASNVAEKIGLTAEEAKLLTIPVYRGSPMKQCRLILWFIVS